MKKSNILLVCGLIICLSLVGCGGAKNESNSEPVVAETQDSPANETAENDEVQLKAPVMESWELYNPNGFDTVTAIISNPNDVAIDISFDLTFYKGGAMTGKIEGCFNDCIMPGKKDVVWANVDVPKSSDADDVKMENIVVTEAYETPIDGKYESGGVADGEGCYNFTFDSQPTFSNIWLLQYNDDNGNGKYDKGEIVVAENDSLYEQTGSMYYDVQASNCEVYFKAY